MNDIDLNEIISLVKMSLSYEPHPSLKDKFLVFGDKKLYNKLLAKFLGRWHPKHAREGFEGAWVVPVSSKDAFLEVYNQIDRQNQIKQIQQSGKSRKDQNKYHRSVSMSPEKKLPPPVKNLSPEETKVVDHYKKFSEPPSFRSPVYDQESSDNKSEESVFPKPRRERERRRKRKSPSPSLSPSHDSYSRSSYSYSPSPVYSRKTHRRGDRDRDRREKERTRRPRYTEDDVYEMRREMEKMAHELRKIKRHNRR